MSDYHIYSGTGGASDPFATWATAAASLTAALAATTPAPAAGDNFWFNSSHSGVTTGNLTWTFPGTASDPNKIVSGTPGTTSGLTAEVSGAAIGTTNGSVTIEGSFIMQGVSIACTTEMQLSYATSNAKQVYDNCTFAINSGTSARRIRCGTAVNSITKQIDFTDSTFSFSHADQGFSITSAGVEIKGGALSGTAITALIRDMAAGVRGPGKVDVIGLDMSGGASTMALVNAAAMYYGAQARFAYCKMHATWTGGAKTGSWVGPGPRVEAVGCRPSGSADSVLYDLASDYFGDLVTDLSVYRSTGAQAISGGTRKSWSITTAGACQWKACGFATMWLPVWTTTGSKTFTVQLLHNGAALDDTEVVMELMALDASTSPLANYLDTAAATYTAEGSGSALASGEGTGGNWTLGGTPVSEKLTKTVTISTEGYVMVRVVFYVPGRTIYMCPKVDVT